MTIVGHCPKCGAPIYGEAEIPAFEAVDAEKRLGGEGPKVTYSCECRKGFEGIPPMFVPPAVGAPVPLPPYVPGINTSPNSNQLPVDLSGTVSPFLGPPIPWVSS